MDGLVADDVHVGSHTVTNDFQDVLDGLGVGLEAKFDEDRTAERTFSICSRHVITRVSSLLIVEKARNEMRLNLGRS